MGSQDALRNPDLRVGPATDDTPLPISEHARARHRSLSDTEALRNLVLQSPDRLRRLIRAAFEVEPAETGNGTTMRMPPFMRQSNALPLTLSGWQYDLVMRWVDEVLAPPTIVAGPSYRRASRMPPRPAARRCSPVSAEAGRADGRRTSIARRRPRRPARPPVPVDEGSTCS
ncbi:MAG: hypothetical protein HWD60_02835 [Defluviicoccus sp.]|nr:MAG: hypothetical protein HWD60_02835 [Defluviicoccus sp.]